MTSPNTLVVGGTRFFSLSLSLIVSVVLCAQSVAAESAIYITDRQPVGEPQRVEIETGKYKIVLRNKDGQVLQEDTYEVSGSLIQLKRLVEERRIISVYANGQTGKTAIYSWGEEQDTSKKRLEEFEYVEYDDKGSPVQTEVMKFDPKGHLKEASIYPGGRSSPIRVFMTYDPVKVSRFQTFRDGKWEDLPGQPHVPANTQTSSQSASAGSPGGQAQVRGGANGQQQLLVASVGSLIDTFQIKLPENFTYTVAFQPRGWTAVRQGRELTFSGLPSDEVRFRLDSGANLKNNLVGKKIEYKGMLNGKTISSTSMQVNLAPDAQLVKGFDDHITLPTDIPVNTPFLGTRKEGLKGEFSIGSTPLLNMGDLVLGFRGIYKKTDSINYKDEYGEVLAFDDGDKYFIFNPGSQTERLAGQRFGTARRNYAFAGQTDCVNGPFQPNHWFNFKLDGKIDLRPVAASINSVIVYIPDSTLPGEYKIVSVMGDKPVTVLGVEGSIDQNKLWTGTSTTMRLRIVGTDEPLPLKIENKTPTVINVVGGPLQFVVSPGGTNNAIERSVTGIHRGNFRIDYSLNIDQCAPPAKKP